MIGISANIQKRLVYLGSQAIYYYAGFLFSTLFCLNTNPVWAEGRKSALVPLVHVDSIVPGQAIIQFHVNAGNGIKISPLAKAAIVASDPNFNLVRQQIRSTHLEPLFEPNLLRKSIRMTAIDEFLIINYDTDLPFTQVERLLLTVPNLISVEPVKRFPLLLDPNDPNYSQQFYLPVIMAPKAWDVTQGDSTVIIAVVDNGFDLQHPDLASNYYTDYIEARGLAGIDDDGNGLIDDIHGYDFANNDPDPTYGSSSSGYYVHGTHVAGIAAAVGNNEIGVAGIAWKSRILPIKASRDDDPQHVISTYAYRAIQYAIAQDAKVINLSWGSNGSPSPAENAVLDLAYQNGVVVIAAAGNDDTAVLSYPASCHHVISVGGVNLNDQKVDFSDFGKAIDLVAPAEWIFSTLPDGRYGYLDGTSMATAIVTGVTALVWALHPSWTIDQVISQVVFSADNVDNLNPTYSNQLGSGRINAERALTATQLLPPPVKIMLQSFGVDDAIYGNGNQIIEPNETIALYIALSNVSLGSSPALQVELTAPDSIGLLWQQQRVTMVAPADSDFTLPEPIVFSLPAAKAKDFIPMVIHYSGTNVLAGTDSLVLPVGRSPILLIDDDEGENNVEGFYTHDLIEAKIPYSYWSYKQLGEPSLEYLQHFPIIIWFCEWAFPSLTLDDQTLLSSYLDQKGGLFLSGQDIGWDLMDPTSENAVPDAQEFFHNRLHADFVTDNAKESKVTGEAGNEIADGLAFTIYQPGREMINQYPDVLQPLMPARPVWNYANHKGVGGLMYQDHYRLVYFGFGLEAIQAQYNSTPAELNPQRAMVLQRVLNFLHPLRFQPISDQPVSITSVPVLAKYETPDQLPQEVRLYYRLPADTLYHSVQLQAMENEYSGELKLNSQVGTVQYYFEIIDPVYSWYLPVAGKQQPFSFRVGDDTEPPVIYLQPCGAQLALLPDYSISTVIRDNIALDSSRLFLFYHQKNADIDSSKMSYQSESESFRGSISGEFAYGDTLIYWLQANDLAQPANSTRTEPATIILGLDDFEFGLDQWQTTFGDWGLDTTHAFSGKYALKTFPYGSYLNNRSISITTKEQLDLSRASQVELQFHSRFAIESGDAGYVEIKTAENDWQMIAGPFSGFQSNWKLYRVSLAPFIGQSHCNLRFRFESDAQQAMPLSGWLLDQMRLVQDDYITQIGVEEDGTLPVSFVLSAAYPNPFAVQTQFNLSLPVKKKVSISVYNLLGQEVASLFVGILPAGQHQFNWRGLNQTGESLPAGVYLLRVYSDESSCVKKIILLK